MPREPTNNAKWCVDQLFQFMELDLRNRVTAKTGRSRSLELNKLANIMSNAAMAHSAKARAPLTPSRSQRVDSTVTMPGHVRSQLRDVFMHYSGLGERHNCMAMARSNFLKFCQDAGIVDAGLDAVQLTLMFDKIQLGSVESAPGTRMSLADWLEALLTISSHIAPGTTSQEAWDKLVHEYVLQKAGAVLEDKADTNLEEVLQQSEVAGALAAAKKRLQPVFDFYVNEQDISNAEKIGASWKELVTARSQMPMDAFIRFMQDFEIVPKVMTKAKVTQAFRHARFGMAHQVQDDARDMSRISFDEFVSALGYCALLAFNYQEPPVPPSRMGFNESYHQSAKKLWTDDTRLRMHESMQFPDEVLVPAATMEQSIGKEDSPQADTVSCHQSRHGLFRSARSIAQYRTKMASSHGVEVMQIHPEANTLDMGRPAHLASFTADWVGRPGYPLNELAKLKPRRRDPLVENGIYSTDFGVPEKYTQRMSDMIDARVAREQQMEALKLSYLARRRHQRLKALQDSTSRRLTLQTLASQPIIGTSSPRTHSAPAGNLLGSTSFRSGLRAGEASCQLTGSVANSVSTANLHSPGRGDLSGGSLRGSMKTCSRTLLHELQEALDVGLRIRQAQAGMDVLLAPSLPVAASHS